MKNKKKLILIGGISAAAIIAIILCVVLIVNRNPKTGDPNGATGTSQEMTAEEPNVDEIDGSASDGETDDQLPDGTVIIRPDENADGEDGAEPDGEKASEAAKPAEPQTIPDEPDTPQGGVTVGGETPEPYNCGTAGHHCDGPETHAYLTNLELQGCPYCGSHSCASFYAQDQWDNSCYTPSKCPKYDIHKDPTQYCQDCGKKLGDGRNGTCVQFVTEDACPNCGERVKAWTCHSCKK